MPLELVPGTEVKIVLGTEVEAVPGTEVKIVPGTDGRAVPGTDVEVFRWTSLAGDGECTVTWLPTDRLDLTVMSTEVTAIERHRARGYTLTNDRVLSLTSAWLMRQLVAMALEMAPLEAPVVRRCPLCAKPHGRPVVLAPTRDGATVHVSATHSGGLVGVALSRSGAVGLDVEDLHARGAEVWPFVWRALGRPVDPGGAVCGPQAAREAAAAWVRSEALLKATGHGLAVSSRSVVISPGRKGSPWNRGDHGEAPTVTRWPWGDPAGRVSIVDLRPGPRYVAALAAIHDGLDLPAVSRSGALVARSTGPQPASSWPNAHRSRA